MDNNIQPTIKLENLDEYDFLNFSSKPIMDINIGRLFGGKKAVSFENNHEKYEKINSEFEINQLIKGSPLDIELTESNTHHFSFTTCTNFIENLNGIEEAQKIILNALKLSSNFVYISQPNFDSDVILFKKGFKTCYSDSKSIKNHLTSNNYFNIIFNFYKLGFIEDFIIFYTNPIKSSNDKIIHPLNSSSDSGKYDENIHPVKRENVKFDKIYEKLNILITIHGFKRIENILELIKEDKIVLYDSRHGIYDQKQEEFQEPPEEKGKSLMGKIGDFFSTDI